MFHFCIYHLFTCLSVTYLQACLYVSLSYLCLWELWINPLSNLRAETMSFHVLVASLCSSTMHRIINAHHDSICNLKCLWMNDHHYSSLQNQDMLTVVDAMLNHTVLMPVEAPVLKIRVWAFQSTHAISTTSLSRQVSMHQPPRAWLFILAPLLAPSGMRESMSHNVSRSECNLLAFSRV